MDQAVAKNIFPGAVLLCAKDGVIVFHEAFGLADAGAKKSIRPDSIFDLASLTKPLATTLAVAKLMEDDPGLPERSIGSILSEFKDTNKKSITVNMLMRHISGYPAHREYFKTIVEHEDPRQAQLNLLVNQTLEYLPGSKQVYSDLGFMILFRIVETISGRKFQHFIEENIYRPLGISRLFFMPVGKSSKALKEYDHLLVATQHCPWRNRLLIGEVDDENAWAVGGVDGHAGLFGDAESVFRVCDMLVQALNGEQPTLIQHNILTDLVKKDNGFDKTAGFDTPSQTGSSSGIYFSEKSIGHLGFTGTSFWIDPKTSIIVILLTNRIHPTRANDSIRHFRPEIHNLVYKQLVL